MKIAIKMLAWYTAIVAAFSIFNILVATINGQVAIRFTPFLCALNVALLFPMVVFGVLVIIRTWHKD
jgi:hypothetical protein